MKLHKRALALMLLVMIGAVFSGAALGAEAEPLMLLPPWSQTMTGSSASLARLGRQTLR